MSGREAILGKLRAQAAHGADNTKRRAAVANRLAGAPTGVVPKRGPLPADEKTNLFCHNAESVQPGITRVASYDAVPEAVADFLRSKNLPQHVRMGQDKRLSAVPWDVVPLLKREMGAANGADTTGLSHAKAAIAETGTLVITSGSDNPTSVNFLPENHVVVVDARDIEGDLEAALGRVRDEHGKGRMPRTVNMITGPSRSGDIEQTILLGAHGPRTLHVIVVDGS